MRGEAYRVTCPACGEPGAVEVRYSPEYQGEPPMGGTVMFLDDVVEFCRCHLTDQQADAAITAAESGEGQLVESD